MLFSRVLTTGSGGLPLLAPIKRRSFLTYAGATTLALAGCQKNDATPGATDVGSGNIGVLNLAYALEQVEATFYASVLTGDYYTKLAPASAEYQILSDLARHEQVHVDFFRTILSTNALKQLNLTLSDTINFNERTTPTGSGKLGVLNAARQLEDLGVGLYNGAAPFLLSADYLTVLGKIVSVEARHAALLRDLLATNGFVGTDVVDATSRQEISLSPTAALAQLNTYLAADSQLTATKLT
ncbi:ferritin-like domain-containing protein [Hymenobacter sp. UV11]|uniref:ferritin-like domain-containing protein n=1 Tax=Hymenobacter sp. UV11 TaxID=1849735 RepID=UPI00105E8FF9|nr:ferritin-like domain-containing protein [Hymenobacter sp. UV11]TDN37323.1 hypothetical protein A8B98_01930 [Hymenobacter sp. UV11]TFZ68510.1 ferritin-like domain-containing protein [Hymenobacter sp. UV11]